MSPSLSWGVLRLLKTPDGGIRFGGLSMIFSDEPRRRKPIPKSIRDDLYEQQDGKCMYCGRKLDKENVNVDHKTPVKRGGSDNRKNLQILCRRCNTRKRDTTDGEFRRAYKAVGLLPARQASGLPPTRVIPYKAFDTVDRGTKTVQRSDLLKEDLFRQQDGRCMYCGRKYKIQDMDKDKKTPESRGGSDSRKNLQLLCQRCNARKGTMTDGEFRRRYKDAGLLPARQANGRPPSKAIPHKTFDTIAKKRNNRA